MAAAVLLVPLTAGCQMGGPAGGVAHHPAFEQLDQVCFGYEPTVWRDMPGDCQQVIRMIPDEEVHVPAPAVTPAPAEMSVPPTDGAVPSESILDEVPDRGPLDVPRIVAPPVDMPPADTPSAVSPSAVPEVPEPPKQPALETPARETPPAADPRVPPAAEPEPPVSSMQPQFRPVVNGPVARTSTSKVSAAALFQTVSQALGETSRSGRVAKQPAAVSLSRFISY